MSFLPLPINIKPQTYYLITYYLLPLLKKKTNRIVAPFKSSFKVKVGSKAPTFASKTVRNEKWVMGSLPQLVAKLQL